MKKNLLFLIIFISLIGCKESKNQQGITVKKPVILIDTTKKGNIGEKESNLEIITRLDTIIIKRISKYWESKTKTYERFEYFDSLGNEYKQIDFSNDKDGFEHSYVWYDTLIEKNMFGNFFPKNIAKKDSIFRKNGKVKETRQTYGNTELTEYFNTNNIVFKKHIYSSDLVYSYIQEGNEFYKRRNDIPLEYAEWIPASKTDFGMAINQFYDSQYISENRFKKLYNISLE